ncbi:MAG TPA: AAA family ATPase [Devosiaceae bacterium]|nr:AAA family ATPase [Devosiaceae bacterium]
MLEIEELGRRIMICGPSNGGKSTLASALGRRLNIPAVHLDLLHHRMHTDWEPLPREEFEANHAAAIAGDSWAMEGNYFALMPARLERATGVILVGSSPLPALLRYFRRTLFQRDRPGDIGYGRDRIKWELIHMILFVQPKKRARDLALLTASGLPMVTLRSMRELNAYYRFWSLDRNR